MEKLEKMSRKYIKDLSEEEVQEIITNDSPEVFINEERDKLTRVPENKSVVIWQSRLKGHIATCKNEYELNDFENGYYFVVQLWVAKEGKKYYSLNTTTKS